jgi:DNA-binding Lrp family transcriptional regulator
MTPDLSDKARLFLNQFQGGFPIARRPFLQVAAKLGMTESALISLVGSLLEKGYLSRFGPLFNAAHMGGSHVLAAMAVPENRFSSVADLVNGFPEVAHNYRRQHDLNMWFVVSAESPGVADQALSRLEAESGLRVFRFPKQREFYVGLFLQLENDGGIRTVSRQPPNPKSGFHMTAFDRDLVVACQTGLPLVPEPYGEIAHRLGAPLDRVLDRLADMRDHGVIRRIGAVPNHYRLGLRANGMTVWNVPREQEVELGQRIGSLPFVSHCYLRPRYAGIWDYNLFAMLHGVDRDSVERKRARIREILGHHLHGEDTLYSTEILKKSGLRLAA